MAVSPTELIRKLVPQDAVRRLAWLGSYDWLQPIPLENARTDLKVRFPQFDGRISKGDYQTLEATIKFAKEAKIMSEVAWMWTLSRLFASGPKMFIPTLEQCEAMCNVEIEIPVKEYRQPYPVIMYQYPDAFSKAMSEKLGCSRFPKMAVCHHDTQSGFIHISSIFAEGDAIAGIIPPREDQTVERILTLRSDGAVDENEPEFQLGEMLQRIALNFSLMMTHYNVTDKPLEREAWRRHRDMQKDKSKEKREKGRLLSIQDIRVIEFEQHVEMYETRIDRSEPGEPTGRHVKPHWRKGHWRMQAHGPLLALRKRIFIKPLMVKKEIFVGEYSDTTVVYHGKQAS